MNSVVDSFWDSKKGCYGMNLCRRHHCWCRLQHTLSSPLLSFCLGAGWCSSSVYKDTYAQHAGPQLSGSQAGARFLPKQPSCCYYCFSPSLDVLTTRSCDLLFRPPAGGLRDRMPPCWWDPNSWLRIWFVVTRKLFISICIQQINTWVSA